MKKIINWIKNLFSKDSNTLDVQAEIEKQENLEEVNIQDEITKEEVLSK